MFTSEPKIAAATDAGEARPSTGASPTSTSHRHTAAKHRTRRARRVRRALERSRTPAIARILIDAAIPQNAERARCQGAWINVVDQHIAEEHDLGRLRADAATNTRTIAWAICRYTDWHTMCTRPGWELLADLTGLSKSTVKRTLRRLRGWGLLGVVETGSTWRTRGFRRDDDKTNRGAVYVLCVPTGQQPVEISDPPSRRELEEPHTHARETPDSPEPKPTTNLWPIGEAPKTRRDRLRASQRLHDQSPILRRLPTAHYLRHLLQPVFAAGWSPAQVLHALDHTPDGVRHWQTADVRHVPAWVRHRLAAWQREDGTWITPAAQLGAGRTTDLTADQVAALPRPSDKPAADVATNASRARAMLAERLRKVTRKQPQRLGLGVSLPDTDGRQTLASEPQTAVEPAATGDDWLLRNAAAAAKGAA